MDDAGGAVFVFLGPSLPRDEARAILPARYLPPAGKGDIDRARAEGAATIVLIDGVFHRRPSVWHREIVDALRAGLRVYGAGSMGAIRAAELHTLGMIGHGTIFGWYRDGLIDGDDEVALLHGDEEHGFRALSLPLVEVRATAARAVAEGRLDPGRAEELVACAKSSFYADRSWASLLACPALARWSEPSRAALADCIERRRVEPKREDAIAVLHRCAAKRDPAPVVEPPPCARVSAPAEASVTRDAGAPLPKGYTRGTHRLVPPEQTLTRIAPHLAALGVTRCADITGLDRIGVPVCCAIRPLGHLLQVTNGKGLLGVDARVSALMEAIELQHAERLPAPVRRAPAAELLAEGRPVIAPEALWGHTGVAADGLLGWVLAEDLVRGERAWIPASAVYAREAPELYRWSSNGLASGNHLVEASLHAIYELIERDAIARLAANERRLLNFDGCRCVDLDTMDDAVLTDLRERLVRADIGLSLLHVPARASVHVFLAVLLDRSPFGMPANLGYGAHRAPSIAAVRAITEAIQSRLTYIHGARQGLRAEAYSDHPAHGRVYRFFDALRGEAAFQSFEDLSSDDLAEDCASVVANLASVGCDRVLCADLTEPGIGIPVVKVFVPGLGFTPELF